MDMTAGAAGMLPAPGRDGCNWGLLASVLGCLAFWAAVLVGIVALA